MIRRHLRNPMMLSFALWLVLLGSQISMSRTFSLFEVRLSASRLVRAKTALCMALADDSDDEEDSDVDETDESDWMQAELTLMNMPTVPHPELEPEQVALACCRSLQWVDYPQPGDGLRRCYDFFTFECRKAVTARQGGQSVDRFIE